MKKIEAIIKPFKLEDVKTALQRLGIDGMTVTEVKGFGRQKGRVEIGQGGDACLVDFLPKIKIDVVVPASLAPAAMEAVGRAARTGNLGDGRVFLSEVESVTRIRTAERGETAI